MNNFKLFYKLSTGEDQNRNVSPVDLKKPVIVDLVEMDKETKVKYDPDCVRYFKLPEMLDYPLNLNAGVANYTFRNEYYFKYKLREVFHYLMENCDGQVENEPNQQVDVNKAECLSDEKFDVISHRGALTELLMVPLKTGLHPSDEWTISAAYHNKKLYLHKSDGIGNDKSATQTYHFKFAQYCFTDDPAKDPDTSAPIREDEQMFCIYRSQLKNLNLIYSAEINGVLSDTKLENVKNFEELNKCRFVHTKLMRKNLRNWRNNYRIQRWWAKSYFSAVNDIYVGFRSDSGIVEDPVQHVELDKLLKEQKWSPKECSSFLYKILTKIIEEMKDVNCPYTTYEIHFDPVRYLIEFKKYDGKTDKTFLTEEYIKHITKN